MYIQGLWNKFVFSHKIKLSFVPGKLQSCWPRKWKRSERFLGLGQTSNVSWNEPNSNLGRPKLSLDRLLGQMSKLGCVEPFNWTRSVINFPWTKQYTLSNKFLIYELSWSHVKTIVFGIWKCWFSGRGENRTTRKKISRSNQQEIMYMYLNKVLLQMRENYH